MVTSALVIVDLSNDGVHPDGWTTRVAGAPAPPAVVRSVQQLLPAVRKAGSPVIWVDWGVAPDLSDVATVLIEKFDAASPGHGLATPVPGRGHLALTAGHWGSLPAEVFAREDGDHLLVKTGLDAFTGSGLSGLLIELGVDEIVLAGVQAEQCVLATAFAASAHGYRVTLLQDAVAGADADAERVVADVVRVCLGEVVTTEAYAKRLQEQVPA